MLSQTAWFYRVSQFLHFFSDNNHCNPSAASFWMKFFCVTHYAWISLWLGTIEAQWFRRPPELETQDQGESPTITAVGHHWGPVILTSTRIGNPGPGRVSYCHCGLAPLRPSDSDFHQNWKPRTTEIPLLFSNDSKWSFRCMNHRQSTYTQPVELQWWTCSISASHIFKWKYTT
jgi:hypothetical protein